jgi:hypothetical protein
MTRPLWTGLAGLVVIAPASVWPDTVAKILVPQSIATSRAAANARQNAVALAGTFVNLR